MLNTDYKFGEVHCIADQIETGSDKVHFKPIFSNENCGVVLVAFKAGQKLDTHVAPAELMVNVLEGEIEFTVLDKPTLSKPVNSCLWGLRLLTVCLQRQIPR